MQNDKPVINEKKNFRLDSPERLLKYGIIVLDKPAGPSSHQVAAWVRDMLGASKCGHAGTLDPNVTGVLVIAVENATRSLFMLSRADKEYVGIMTLHSSVKRTVVEKMFKEFHGEILQMPPLKSAVKRELRPRKIHELDLLEMEGKDVLFRVRCEAGTYIRTLCHDIGEALGTGANMQELRRIDSGGYLEGDAISLHDLKDAYVFWKEMGRDKELLQCIKPMELLFDEIPKVTVKDSAVDALCHGADLAVPGIVKVDGNFLKGDRVALFSQKEEVIGVGNALMEPKKMASGSEGFAVSTSRIFMEPGTYKSHWKKKQ